MPDKKHSDTFCTAPFNSLTVTTTGRAALCCSAVAKYSFPDGYKNIKDLSDVDEWWDGEYMRSVRRAMLRGDRLKECERCYRLEALGHESWRQQRVRDEAHDIDRPVINYMDIKFGNKCNLRCKMCWPHSSSELLKEWRRLGWDAKDPMEGQRDDHYAGYLDEDYEWPRDQRNIDKLMGAMKHVDRLKFSGGEPTASPQFFQFLEGLVRAGHSDGIVLDINTNGTNIHPRLLPLARRFRSFCLRISIDGHDGTYEYIRYPARWPRVEHNIRTYASWFKTGEVRGEMLCEITASVFNLHQLVQISRRHSWWADRYEVCDLDEPRCMSWRHAPQQVQKQALKDAVALSYDPDQKLAFQGRQLVKQLTREFSVPTAESRQRLREFVTQQDQGRGIHIRDYIPHLVETTRL